MQQPSSPHSPIFCLGFLQFFFSLPFQEYLLQIKENQKHLMEKLKNQINFQLQLATQTKLENKPQIN